jgi:hypothetical protein
MNLKTYYFLRRIKNKIVRSIKISRAIKNQNQFEEPSFIFSEPRIIELSFLGK